MLGGLSVRAHNLLMFGLILLTVLTAAYAVWPRPIRVSGTTLEFVAMGKVDPGLMQRIAHRAAAVYHLPYSIAVRPLPLLASACDQDSGQYDTFRLRQWLRRRPVGHDTHMIAIASSDVTAKGFNFLLGEADLPGQVCVMSIRRLGSVGGRHAVPEATLTARAVSIAVHELGHTYGFHHCPNPGCVMSFANTVSEVDDAGITFCPRCRASTR